MFRPSTIVAIAGALALGACQTTVPNSMNVRELPFGVTKDGTPVRLFELTSKSGAIARISDYGATLVELWIADRDGALADVVLGFDDVSGYESEANQYFGCTVGRVANRIAKGEFELDGETYRLAINNGPNSLHGGDARALSRVMWHAEPASTLDGPAVRFSYASPGGEEGYPGELAIAVTYTLTHEGELRIDYEATTNAATPVNLTNHAYWNLAGQGAPTVLDHELYIGASLYTPVDETLIPIGTLDVVTKALDFRIAKPIGRDIWPLTETPTLGYDHNYALDSAGSEFARAAVLYHPGSGRELEIWTTEPGLQFYSGNFLFGQTGKQNQTYALRSACCLETQHFPDSVNEPRFPSIILRPGETYRQTTVHRFGVR